MEYSNHRVVLEETAAGVPEAASAGTRQQSLQQLQTVQWGSEAAQPEVQFDNTTAVP